MAEATSGNDMILQSPASSVQSDSGKTLQSTLSQGPEKSPSSLSPESDNQSSPCVQSDSGYSTSSYPDQTMVNSLSDQAGQLTDLTMESLELLNNNNMAQGSPSPFLSGNKVFATEGVDKCHSQCTAGYDERLCSDLQGASSSFTSELFIPPAGQNSTLQCNLDSQKALDLLSSAQPHQYNTNRTLSLDNLERIPDGPGTSNNPDHLKISSDIFSRLPGITQALLGNQTVSSFNSMPDLSLHTSGGNQRYSPHAEDDIKHLSKVNNVEPLVHSKDITVSDEVIVSSAHFNTDSRDAIASGAHFNTDSHDHDDVITSGAHFNTDSHDVITSGAHFNTVSQGATVCDITGSYVSHAVHKLIYTNENEDSNALEQKKRKRKPYTRKGKWSGTAHSTDFTSDKDSGEDVLNRPPPHILPLCKVCGVQATGFHYGVNTCEACKGFFRRSIIRKHPYMCANNSVKCTILPNKRSTCPACRYKKCLEAGMSVEGIKIGRYTYAKRTQDILELQEQSPMKPDPDTKSMPISPETTSDLDDRAEFEQDDETQSFIDTVLAANDAKYPEDLKNLSLVEKVEQQIKIQHETGNLDPSLMSSNVPMAEFLKVLMTTGVQLDNRLQVLQRWMSLLNDALRFVVTFAKEIPGFKDLSLTDQMALIKHSICEVWIIGRHKAVHMEHDLFTTRTGMTIDVIHALGENLGGKMLIVGRELRKLNLTADETVILKALVIFFTDRCELKEADKVATLQQRLLDALLYLFRKRGAHPVIFGKISSCLTILRDVNIYYQDYTEKLRLLSLKDGDGPLQFPPLFLEVINRS